MECLSYLFFNSVVFHFENIISSFHILHSPFTSSTLSNNPWSQTNCCGEFWQANLSNTPKSRRFKRTQKQPEGQEEDTNWNAGLLRVQTTSFEQEQSNHAHQQGLFENSWLNSSQLTMYVFYFCGWYWKRKYSNILHTLHETQLHVKYVNII